MFSTLSILPRCGLLPAHIRTRIEHIGFLTSITVRDSALPFLDEVRCKELDFKDLLPNVKCIEYNVQALHVAADERMAVEEWFQKAGDVELRPHII